MKLKKLAVLLATGIIMMLSAITVAAADETGNNEVASGGGIDLKEVVVDEYKTGYYNYIFEVEGINNLEDGTTIAEFELYDSEGAVLGTMKYRPIYFYGSQGANEVTIAGLAYITKADGKVKTLTLTGTEDTFTMTAGNIRTCFSTSIPTHFKVLSEETLEDIDVSLNLRWSEETPGKLLFDESEDLGGYQYELYYNDEFVRGQSFFFGDYSYDSINFMNYIDESGTYAVKVKPLGDIWTAGEGEWEETITYEYVKPEQKIGVPSKVWWTIYNGQTLPTVMNWEPVPGASGYVINLYDKNGDITSLPVTVYNRNGVQATSTFTFYPGIVSKAETLAPFTFTVQAITGNIEIYSKSEATDVATSGEWVAEETKKEEVKDALTETADVETVIEIVETEGASVMADVMTKDTEVRDKIKDIEDSYAESKNITVEAPAVTHPKVDGEVKVVGAGLNANEGKKVKLTIDKIEAEDKKDIDRRLYKNTVQMNISLKEEDEKISGELKVPVTITMPVPTGVDVAKMIILHYLSDGTVETIIPINNGDSTVSFSVTSFSTFVFANIVQYDSEGFADEAIAEDDNNDDSDDVIGNDDNNDDNTGAGDDNDDNTGVGDDNDGDDIVEVPGTSMPGEAEDVDGAYNGFPSYHDVKQRIKSHWNGRKGWMKVSNKWYFFENSGELKTGWVQDDDGKWYYMDAETADMKTGWVCSPASGLWYYMETSNGHMLSAGWVCDPESGRWYYLDADGAMCTNWITVDGKWYLLDKNGAMCTGWNLVDGNWYFLNNSGEMLTGWQKIGDKEYFFDAKGKCLMDTTTPDGHKVDKSGAKVK
ncbi:MAG: N-acetylmuramoyl-L-alanine amidase family protein [Lachnospiraceae bacterium]|nr:N-acetylmuramoyl-L-alanine amidase family protein [Lachnospiraceae bacterium]